MNDNTWGWVIGIIVVLLIIAGIWWWASSTPTTTPPTTTTTQTTGTNDITGVGATVTGTASTTY